MSPPGRVCWSVALLVSLAALAGGAAAEHGTPETTQLVSRPSGTVVPAPADSTAGALGAAGGHVSADGRYVVFASDADGLSTEDDDTVANVFVRDTLTDTTVLASRANGAAGAAPTASSSEEQISADGTKVAFVTTANDLVAGDTDGLKDVFVRDLVNGTTALASIGTTTKDASAPALSADGTKAAFVTDEALAGSADANTSADVYLRHTGAAVTTLVTQDGTGNATGVSAAARLSVSSDGDKVAFVSPDAGGVSQVYVRAVIAATTTLVSRAEDGTVGDAGSGRPSLSADGTKVAFESVATNLGGDGTSQIYVRDVALGHTVLASRADGALGAPGDAPSTGPSLDAAGTRVAFRSLASNLASGDGAGTDDVFVRDLGGSTTTLVSRASGGTVAGQSFAPSLSGNGDCVTFQSGADDLTAAAPASALDRVFLRTLGRECPVEAPDTSIDSGPAGLTNQSAPTFGLSSNDSAPTFRCTLDAEPEAPCATPFTTHPLVDGAHAVTARAVDPAGYQDATPATRAFTVDTVPPDTALSGGPTGAQRARSALFTFGASEPGALLQCRVDGGAFAGCASPLRYTGLPDGSHTFFVRAVDAAGNSDSSPATRGWDIDATAPKVTLTVAAQKLGNVIKRGLSVRAGCSETCTIVAELRLGPKLIGTATAKLAPGGIRVFVVKLTKAAKASLKKPRRVNVTLGAWARDGIGNASIPLKRKLTLRR
jgi:Tol biopolymer transport system component